MLNRQRKQEPAFSHPLVKRMLPWKSETASLLFLTCSMLFFFFSPPPRGVFMMLFFFRSEITGTRRDASEETQTGRAVTGRSAQPSPLTLRCPCRTCAGLRGEGGETAPNLGHPAPKKSPASMQQWQRDHSAPCQCCRAGSLLRRWGGGLHKPWWVLHPKFQWVLQLKLQCVPQPKFQWISPIAIPLPIHLPHVSGSPAALPTCVEKRPWPSHPNCSSLEWGAKAPSANVRTPQPLLCLIQPGS